MGIHLKLMRVSQRGTSPKGRKLTLIRTVVDGDHAFESLLIRMYGNGRTPTLDRACHTNRVLYLHHNEMDLLIPDIEAARALAHSPAELDLLDGLLSLARECIASDDLLLAFEAD